MADDGLSLLFRLKAQNQASPVVHQVQGDVAKLRQSVGSDFNALQQVSTTALTKISQSITGLSSQAPVLGGALQKINDAARSFGSETAKAAPAAQKLKGEIDGLARISGKSSSELTTFVKSFAKLEDSSAKSAASIKFFGGQVDALSGNVTARFIPQLEALSSEMTEVGVAGTSTAASLAAIAGPIGIAVVAIGAAAVGVVKLSEALFDLAKIAGDTQGKLFDLSQQTGVSVETLAGLEELAKTTGGSLESIAQSLVVFQGNIEAAQDPTSKQAEIFKRLGVETENTEDALRQTLAAIAKMPEGFRQTNEAAELFGRRGGKQFLAILKESHGDIDATIRELQSMGLANTDAAKRADEFNDQLVHLNTQLTALQVKLGNEVIPQVIKLSEVVLQTIKDNQGAVDALAFVVRGLAGTIGFHLTAAIKILDGFWKQHEPEIRLIAELYERLAAAMQLVSGNVPNITGNEIGAVNLTGGNADSLKELQALLQKQAATDQAKQELQKALAKFDLQKIFGDQKKSGADEGVQLLKQLQGELQKLENATKAETVATELLDKKYKDLNPTLRAQILLTARSIDLKNAQAEVDKKINEETDKRKSAIAAEIQSLNAFIEAQTRAIHGTYTALEQADEFILRFENLSGAMDKNQIHWLRFNALVIDLNEHLKDLPEQLRKVAESMAAIKFPEPKEGEGFDSVDALNAIAPQIQKIFDLQQAFDDLGESIRKVFDGSKDFKLQFGDVIGGVLGDIEQAIGSLVEQYVLLGTTGPAALRKLLAATLAHLAAEASVKAVFQLAEGFAALFINPAEAAAHFTSAAIFGSIAGGAAIAGRAAAGDLFQQKPSGGSSGASGGSNQLNPLTVNRNQPQTMRIVFEHRVNDSEFGKAITTHVVRDVRERGPIIESIANDN